jgi:hypothetical protein
VGREFQRGFESLSLRHFKRPCQPVGSFENAERDTNPTSECSERRVRRSEPRGEVYFEHGAAEKAEGRYPSLSAMMNSPAYAGLFVCFMDYKYVWYVIMTSFEETPLPGSDHVGEPSEFLQPPSPRPLREGEPTMSQRILPAGLSDVARALAEDAETDILLKRINPNIGTIGDAGEFDPRAPAIECTCHEASHEGKYEVVQDNNKAIGTIILAHIPFPLVKGSGSPQNVPGFDFMRMSGNQKNQAAFRLGYQLHGKPGIEDLSHGRYSAQLLIGKVFALKPAVHLLETSLRHAGCPDFRFDQGTQPIGFKL